MLGIVLPRITTPLPVRGVLPVGYVLPIGIVYEGVVTINVDVVVAAPAAVVAPAAAPGCSHGHPDTEGNCHTRGVITHWRVHDGRISVNRWAVHHGRVVTGNVYNFRVGLLNH